LQQARLADVRRYLQLVSEEWDETIGRLKRYVER
jgi:hypothetical protein